MGDEWVLVGNLSSVRWFGASVQVGHSSGDSRLTYKAGYDGLEG